MDKIKEQFISWQAQNPNASKTEQRNKIAELKRNVNSAYTPEKNVENAIKLAESEGKPDLANRLRKMQSGDKNWYSDISAVPYEDRYTGMFGQPLSAIEAKQREALYPRLMQNVQQGNNFAPASAMLDIASLPGRAYESILSSEPALERMGQVETGNTASDIVRSPYNVLSAGIGGVASKAGASLLSQFGTQAMSGAMQQAPISLAGQAEKMERGQSFNAPEFGKEVAIGAAFGPLGSMANKTIKGVGEIAKKTLGTISGKSVALLETVGGRELKEGARRAVTPRDKFSPDLELAKIKNYQQKAEEITGDVIGYLDNFEDLYRKENAVVNDAIETMGNIDLSSVIDDLNRMKVEALPIGYKGVESLPKNYRTGKKAIDDYLENIDNVIDDITTEKILDPSGNVISTTQTNIRPASEVLKLRRKIDETINFNKSNYSTDYQKKLEDIGKKARTGLKNKLEESAQNTGNKEYIDAMANMSRYSNVRDRIYSKIMSKDGSQDKVKNFLISLGNPDKLDNQLLARDVEKMLGKDLFEKSNILRLSKEYNNGLNVFTDVQTGKSNYLQSGLEGAQKAGAMLLGSPKFGAAPLTAGINRVIGRPEVLDLEGNLIKEAGYGMLTDSPLLSRFKRSAIEGNQQ